MPIIIYIVNLFCPDFNTFTFCRILEANGRQFLEGCTLSDLNQVTSDQPAFINVVVLREATHDTPDLLTEADMENLKEDLTMAMLEVETLQEEKKDLQQELNV